MKKIIQYSFLIILSFSSSHYTLAQTAEEFLQQGIAKNNVQDYTGALQDLNSSILLKTSYEAYAARALVLYNTGNYSDAVRNDTHALEINPNGKEAYLNRGKSLFAIGNHRAAISDFEKVIEIDNTNAEAFYYQGLCEKIAGSYEEAIQYYNKAIELNPDNAETYNARAIANYFSGNDAAAMMDINKSIELNKDNGVAYFNLGNFNYFDDDMNNACINWSIASKLKYSEADLYVKKYCTSQITGEK